MQQKKEVKAAESATNDDDYDDDDDKRIRTDVRSTFEYMVPFERDEILVAISIMKSKKIVFCC